jgi:hypothetical protein
MNETEHIARQQLEAEYASRYRALGGAAGREWARTAYSGEFRRLAAAAGRYETVWRYVEACGASPFGRAVRVYLDIYPREPDTSAAEGAYRYWDAVFPECGHLMGNRDTAVAFVTAALAVWADVGPEAS